MLNDDYPEMMECVRKVPTDFLDVQIANEGNLKESFHYNFNKIIWSYNGSQEIHIKKLMAMKYGMKKLLSLIHI